MISYISFVINEPLPGMAAPDSEMEAVFAHLAGIDQDGTRMAKAIRRTFDMLLDGQHTGRFRWEQLHKTEKTHCGTLIEINLQREFDFADGTVLDYSISGIEVDCKYSQQLGNWMIPPEAVGRILLGIWANDKAARWSAGLVRASEGHLNSGTNRDAKRTLSRNGRKAICWLFKDAPLQENILLSIPDEDVDAIFRQTSGQRRVNELFRRAQRRPISRAVVATVAMQEDYMKRVRGNGGARGALRSEGIVIFGQYKNHVQAAVTLGLTAPGPGEFVSTRLACRRTHHGLAPYLELDGEQWVLARGDDPVEPAPLLPDIGQL
ncbi:NaeI family type II restriction endonuclease [Streptosporangium sp. NPDC000095]|uniref:NaeI family type II restriction endonuclease n=1 Tax=Streptosporangium sp. NPDC000095 TaxID=3366184 RepID=UPI0036B2A731